MEFEPCHSWSPLAIGLANCQEVALSTVLRSVCSSIWFDATTFGDHILLGDRRQRGIALTRDELGDDGGLGVVPAASAFAANAASSFPATGRRLVGQDCPCPNNRGRRPDTSGWRRPNLQLA